MKAAVLLVREPGRRARRVRLEEGTCLVVGRSTTADLQLEDPSVSRKHAEIAVRDDGALVVTDLASRHGTVVVGPAGTEELLVPGEERELGEGEALRMGGTELVPCEPLGENVFLSGGGVGRDTLTSVTGVSPRAPAAPLGGERAAAALARLASLETVLAGEDPWKAVLRVLVEVAKADRGFLLALAGARFVVRAAIGAEGPVVLSRAFLDETARRPGAWTFRTGEADSPLPGESIFQYSPGLLLVGVRFPDPGGDEPVAVGCLEMRKALPDDALPVLDLVARATAPLLHHARELDLARRREEAALAELAERRGERAGTTAGPGPGEPALVGESRAFREAVELARRAAASSATVLVLGPSGSGKEQLARLLHVAGPRREQPFVVVNCAAIPEGLVESELFGHERGAFTGADRPRAGAFERADGGTLFLDEIGDLDLDAQAKLLRVLETGEVTRLGGTTHWVDVRVVAATHRDLAEMVREGTFREDLWYRLRVIEIVLPPLRERPEDVLPLARHFLAGFRRADGGIVEGISARAARALARYPWPGNVRELRNLVERAVVLDRDGVLDLDDLPPGFGAEAERAVPPGATGALGRALAGTWDEAREAWERLYFETLVHETGGNLQEVACRAGVDRRTVTNKVRKLRLAEAVRRAREGDGAA